MNDATQAKLLWEESADAWINRGADTNRTHLLDPAMLDCLGHVSGLRILDIGCGEGRFCRMLAASGARTTGGDLTGELIRRAKCVDATGSYLLCNAEELPFASSVFDVAVSYVALVDVADYHRAILEMARVIVPGGRVIAANVNSLASTSPAGWYRDAHGNKLHYPVDRYFEERAIRLEWDGLSVINWHRPLQAYMSAYLDAGLVLRRFVEPQATPAVIAEQPKMIDERRIALFNVMVWEKPGAG